MYSITKIVSKSVVETFKLEHLARLVLGCSTLERELRSEFKDLIHARPVLGRRLKVLDSPDLLCKRDALFIRIAFTAPDHLVMPVLAQIRLARNKNDGRMEQEMLNLG